MKSFDTADIRSENGENVIILAPCPILSHLYATRNGCAGVLYKYRYFVALLYAVYSAGIGRSSGCCSTQAGRSAMGRAEKKGGLAPAGTDTNAK